MQSDGEIVAGGEFTTLGGNTRNHIGRLFTNGTLDTTLNQGSESTVNALAIQPDGKIVVGGSFVYFGTPYMDLKSYFVRIANNMAALQELNVANDGESITWLRSGASPEVWRVTFELSTDGEAFTSLGDGTHISGGWQLQGLSLLHGQNLWIRARGFYNSGQYNGSGLIVESVRNVYLEGGKNYLPLVIK